ncbi:MAG: DUF3566 domain-containing protein [Aeromicrobium sp.]|uniref:DUF3566 domain-containing protein n=1 Tax=Aeromicrobium sp. TaxID=1871063 RepID=UPI0039E5F515
MTKRKPGGGTKPAPPKPLPEPVDVSGVVPPADDPPADDHVAVAAEIESEVSEVPATEESGEAVEEGPESVDSEPEPRPSGSAGSSPLTRPMTAADYARTVSEDPASTSMFPPVTPPAEAKAAPKSSGSPVTSGSNPGRQARLSLVHVDPWSVTQLAFVVSTALMVVAVVAVTVFWLVLNVTGVWDNLNDAINSVLSSEDGTFEVKNYFGFTRVVGLTLVLSAINVILMTALAAVGTRLYNTATHLVGGIQVTFRDRT